MGNTKTFKIKGMHCASCSSIIEKEFKKTAGVTSAEVNYGTETAKVTFDETKTNAEALSKTIEPLGYSLLMPIMEDHSGHNGMMPTGEDHSMHTGVNQSKKEKLLELAELKSKVISVIPLTIFSIFVMGWDKIGRASCRERVYVLV